MPISDCMRLLADVNGYVPTENLEKIAKAKERFFGEDNWVRCCCDRNNPERYCISPLCKKDIEQNGVCHCRAFKKRILDNIE